MNQGSPAASAASLLEEACELLRCHPSAPVCAMNAEAAFKPIPPGIPAAGHPVLSARSSFEIVVPADLKHLVDAWDEATRSGRSSAHVHLAKDGQSVTVEFFDVRELHGVYLIVFVPNDGEAGQPIVDAPSYVDPLPRLCTTEKNGVSVITAVDDAFTRLLGWSREQVVGARSLEYIHPDDQHRAIDNWLQMLAAPGRGYRWRGRHLCANGSYRWLEFTNTNYLDDPDRQCVLGEMVDIADEMAAHEGVRAREQMLLRLAEALPVGVVQFDANHRVTYVNEQIIGIVGPTPRTTIDELFSGVLIEDRPGLAATISRTLGDQVVDSIEIRLVPRLGADPHVCELSLRPLTDEHGAVTGVIGCLSDITERVRLRVALEARATYDALTGCHNRAATMTLLQDLLDRGRHGEVGVVFVDLDHFKPINDQLGHAAGDEVLKAVGSRLRAAVRTRDIVGRIGGDEFLVICDGVDGIDATVDVAERLVSALAEPVVAGDTLIAVRASVGVAIPTPTDRGCDDVVARADVAMYESKRAGAGRPVIAA